MAKKRNENAGRSFWDIAARLHVKKNTAGTSNELSVSVLDDLKAQTESGGKRSARPNRRGIVAFASRKSIAANTQGAAPVLTDGNKGPALGLPSIQGQNKREERQQQARQRALDNPEAEIKRRKRSRRVRRWALACALVVALGAATAFGVHAILEAFEIQQENLALLHQGFDELESADAVILAMDAVVTGDVDDASLEEIASIRAQLPDIEVNLNAAEAFANEASSRITAQRDKDAAYQAQRSVEARREMINQGLILMEADENAKTAVDAIDECWSLVLQADALLKDAAELVVDTTDENVRASEEKTRLALEALNQAQAALLRAQESYAGDYSTLESYIAKRQESIGYALASDAAIYLQDKATAEYQNALYNEADAAAVELAKALPSNPAQPILDAYEANTARARQDYLQARSQAGESDAFLRDYLSGSAQ